MQAQWRKRFWLLEYRNMCPIFGLKHWAFTSSWMKQEFLKAVLLTIELHRNLKIKQKRKKKKEYYVNEVSLCCPNLLVQCIFPFPWLWYLCLYGKCLCRRPTEENMLYWCKPRSQCLASKSGQKQIQKAKYIHMCWPNTPAVSINFQVREFLEPLVFCLFSNS